MSERGHEPVMVDEVLRFLGQATTVMDMTLGAGGHAEALLASGVERVIGLDRDPVAIELATARLARFGERFAAVQTRFSDVPAENRVDGVLYDLGVSSMQLDRPERGFSYRADGPLDMRMGPDGERAMDIVNTAPEEELARIVFEYGEERRSRRVAAAIVRARSRSPIETTDELAGVVASALGVGGALRVPASSGGHPRSRWPRDRDRVPLARGPHRQAVPERRSRSRDPDEEAATTVRRRDGREPEGAEREASSRRAEPHRVSQPARRL